MNLLELAEQFTNTAVKVQAQIEALELLATELSHIRALLLESLLPNGQLTKLNLNLAYDRDESVLDNFRDILRILCLQPLQVGDVVVFRGNCRHYKVFGVTGSQIDCKIWLPTCQAYGPLIYLHRHTLDLDEAATQQDRDYCSRKDKDANPL